MGGDAPNYANVAQTTILLYYLDDSSGIELLKAETGSFHVLTSSNRLHGSLTYNLLPSGTYCVVIYADGEEGTNTSTLRTSITGTSPALTIGPPIVVWTRPGQGQSMGDAIIAGIFDNSFFYSDARDLDYYRNCNENSGNDVFYRFTIEQTMNIRIHHRGTKNLCDIADLILVTIYEDGLYGQEAEIIYSAVIDINNPLEDIFIEKLEPNTYHIVIERGFGNAGPSEIQGVIVTNIEGTYYPGDNIENAISAGEYNDEFEYSDTQDLDNLASGSVYYKLVLSSFMGISISHCGLASSDTKIHLLNQKGQTLEHEIYQSNNIYCSGDTYSTYMAVKELCPGTYYVVSSGDRFIKTTINGKMPNPKGNTIDNPIDLGKYSKEFYISDKKDSQMFSNSYEGNQKDIIYKIELETTMNLSIFHCDSDVESTFITLIDNSGRVLGNSTTKKSESCYISTQASLFYQNLNKGIYYIISEGVSGDGYIATHVQGDKSIEETPENKDLLLSKDKNYVIAITPTAIVKAIGDNPSVDQTLQTIYYYDGFGRLEEVIQRGLTPKKRDIAYYKEYNTFGSDGKQWLPSISEGTGSFIHLEKIKMDFKAIYKADPAPFNEAIYDCSPLRNITEIYGAGMSWRKNKKSIKINHYTNLRDDEFLSCALYQINSSSSLEKRGNYEPFKLAVTEIIDEDENRFYVFETNSGKVVLSRQINNREKHDTYYVYDDFDNLSYVLPPLAVGYLNTDLSDHCDAMKKYAYLYKYDDRNRCIARRNPGADWIYYVYDKADRLIFTQDGEQAKKTPPEWTFTIPDVFGRVVLTGTCTNNLDYSANPLADIVVKAAYNTGRTNLANSYTVTGATLSAPTILSVNFYDGYDFLGITGVPNTPDTQYTTEAGYGVCYGDHQTANKYKNKGLLTGTLTAQMKSDGTIDPVYLYSVMYYDNKKQLVQTKSNNHLTGGIEKECIAYNFTGQPTQRKHIHMATGKNTQTEVYTYTYDHAGRLLQTIHQLTDGTTVKDQVTLAENSYDELGRLKSNKKNNQTNLSTTYAYNIRSWTNSIANPHFNEALTYSYNGNISSMQWKQAGKTRKYSFDYDHLSRLTAANYTGDGQYGTSYTYDKHGNITTLQRSGNTGTSTYGLIDNLTLSYNGNQLIKVEDSAPTVSLTSSTDFVNGVNNATEYFYDLNGNMTRDLNKGISNITYNTLNLPSSLTISNAKGNATNSYVYAADGRKLSTTISGKKTDYVGNIIYENGNLKRILTENGYIEEGKYYFYIKDHLGNNRIVADQSGNVIQSTQYYPFGMAFADGVGESKQPYKYNSKELDTEKGLNWYDYSARYMDFALGRFTTPDPLAEKYYSCSPYTYVGNSPVNRIDPTGMDWHTYIDENGKTQYVWNTNIHSQKELSKVNSSANYLGITYSVNNTYFSLFGQITDLQTKEGRAIQKMDEALINKAEFLKERVKDPKAIEKRTDFDIGSYLRTSALGLSEEPYFDFEYGIPNVAIGNAYYFNISKGESNIGTFESWGRDKIRGNSNWGNGDIKSGYNVLFNRKNGVTSIRLVFQTLETKNNVYDAYKKILLERKH